MFKMEYTVTWEYPKFQTMTQKFRLFKRAAVVFRSTYDTEVLGLYLELPTHWDIVQQYEKQSTGGTWVYNPKDEVINAFLLFLKDNRDVWWWLQKGGGHQYYVLQAYPQNHEAEVKVISVAEALLEEMGE